jgi:hypothetical protein
MWNNPDENFNNSLLFSQSQWSHWSAPCLSLTSCPSDVSVLLIRTVEGDRKSPGFDRVVKLVGYDELGVWLLWRQAAKHGC